ncbi:hypothetical protein A4R43_26980 [Amycolatopsis albispora]|uniref:Uncharacterized protein n=2 Tax=Amycolatopsis albispora TaxID=1804986 RepID=A0A344LCB0_9PSEU|nr:hypothetical protein A4R43_26980 [Amycolatopsis albispora]
MGVFAAVVVGVGVLLGACGQPVGENATGSRIGQGAQPQSAPESDPEVTWANQYCGAVVGLLETMAGMPRVDPTSPQSAATTASDMLGTLVGGLDRTLVNLNGLPASPAPGGDQAKRAAVDSYTGIRDRVQQAKQQLDSAGPGTRQGQEAISAAGNALDEIASADLLSGLAAAPRLQDASRRAPTCSSLTEEGSAPSLATPPPPTA